MSWFNNLKWFKNPILSDEDFKAIKIENKTIDVKSLIVLGDESSTHKGYKIITKDNNIFKLRECKNNEDAIQIEQNISRYKKYFPKILVRSGRFLLLEWIEGKDIDDIPPNKLSPNICRKIGEILGEQHSLNDIDTTQNVDHWFNKPFEIIVEKKTFDYNIIEKIWNTYNNLRKDLHIEVVKEFQDLHQNNIKITDDEKIYFIDEKVIAYSPKGLGLIKPLGLNINPDNPSLKGWIQTKEQEEAFWEGYKSKHNNEYFTKEYQKLIYLLRLIRTIKSSVVIKNPSKTERARLENYKNKIILFLETI